MNRNFTKRRALGFTILALVSLCFFAFHRGSILALGHPQLVTGWALLALMVFLVIYNLRKKLSFAEFKLGNPLTWFMIRSRTWLQLHAYAGILTLFLFLIHIKFQIPTGLFEVGFGLLYLTVAGTGLFGLYLSRSLPPRLTTRGEEVIYERIPGFMETIRLSAEDLVLRSVKEAQSNAIPDFYNRRLHGYFAAPRNFWHHLRESRKPITTLQRDMRDLHRFLSDDEQAILSEIEQAARKKDELDYHHALQSVLKYWLFFHIPLSYALIVLTLLHMLLVNAFGGIR
jgi:hypothetical protein